MKNYQKNARIPNMHFVFMSDHFKMDEQWQLCICTLFEFKFGVEFANYLQCTAFKWNWQVISTMYIILQHLNYVLENLACIHCYIMLCFLSIATEPHHPATT